MIANDEECNKPVVEKEKEKIVSSESDEETEEVMSRLHEIKDENDFITTWCMDGYEFPVRDFSEKHGFKATKVMRTCWCIDDVVPKVPKTQEIVGDTYLDLWRAFDNLMKCYTCGHVLIESLHVKDGIVEVSCGS